MVAGPVQDGDGRLGHLDEGTRKVVEGFGDHDVCMPAERAQAFHVWGYI